MKLVKSKYILLLLFIILSFKIFAQNFSIIGEKYLSPYPSPFLIEFVSSDKLHLIWDSGKNSGWDTKKEFSYSFISDYGMPYLLLDTQIPREIEQGVYTNVPARDFGNKIMFIVGQVPAMERKFNSGRSFYPKVAVGYTVTEDHRKSHVFLRDILSFESTLRDYGDPSSTLVESGITYEIGNLDDLESDTPWVEAADGNGLGESFVIFNSMNEVYPYLFIINGFISADRPRLFLQNGRIKRIKVEGLDSGDFGFCDILDTPHPQTVDIAFITRAEDIKITIIDVYLGSKYEDTAIHYMITYNKKIIPYQDSVE